MTRRRPLFVLVLVALVVALAPACARSSDDKKVVLKAIDATRRLAGRYVYSDERTDRSLAVQGVLDDNFRYKARVSLDGTPAFDEVVFDDALAVRVLDPARLPQLIDPAKAPTAKTTTDLAGVDVKTALASRRWVIDASGAPSQTNGGRPEKEIGNDPVLDSLTVLDYVVAAMNQSPGVRKFDPESLSPTYPRSEDDLPQPVKGSPITRYDLVRPPLPNPDRVDSIGSAQVVQTRHFRKMAIYLQAGRILRVVEKVELTGKLIDSAVRYGRQTLKANKASDSDISRYDASVRSTGAPDFGKMFLATLNQQLQSFGQPPLLVRTMSVEFRDLGSPAPIELPTGDVIHASLGLLITSGRPGGTGAAATAAAKSGPGGGPSATSVPATPGAPGPPPGP